LTEADWEKIAERLEGLARLLWDVGQDPAKAKAPKQPPLPRVDLPGNRG
jgi:hypothetical protein